MYRLIPFFLFVFTSLFAKVESDFFRACLNGEEEKVHELYKEHGKKLIYAKDRDNNTGLHLACCTKKGGNKEKIVEFLISQGADVNAENRFKSTPLVIAVINGSYESVELLLKHPKINPNTQDNHYYSPLQHAVALHSPPMVQLVLSHPKVNPNFGTKDGATPLHFAAMWGYVEEAKILINDPRTDINVTQHDPQYGGATPLHFAALQAQAEIVQMLLDHGDANVHATVMQGLFDGFTPLHFCVMNPETIQVFECVKLLLQAGANPKKKAQVGKTPIEMTEVGIIKNLLKTPHKELSKNTP